MTGQQAYEADVKAEPLYRDGTPRKTWEQLGEVEQWSWNRPPLNFPRWRELLTREAAELAIRKIREAPGFIDLFHFAGDDDAEGREGCLQIVVDPVTGQGNTFHARFWPDGRVNTFSE
jgi:hypothetical protein